MAVWSSVPGVVTGQVADVAWANSVKSTTDLAGRYRKRFRAAKTSGTIPNSGGTFATASVAFVDSVLFDNDAMCSGGHVNINTAGVWAVTLTVEWNANVTGLRFAAVYDQNDRRVLGETKTAVNNASAGTTHNIMALEYFDADDQLTVKLSQSSGAALGMSPYWWGCSLMGFLVSG